MIQSENGASESPQTTLLGTTFSTLSSASSSHLLTEQDIIMHLSSKPLRTKELISLVKNKLKASPENKERFRVFVKRLATVRVSGDKNDDEDRYLELKTEYRT